MLSEILHQFSVANLAIRIAPFVFTVLVPSAHIWNVPKYIFEELMSLFSCCQKLHVHSLRMETFYFRNQSILLIPFASRFRNVHISPPPAISRKERHLSIFPTIPVPSSQLQMPSSSSSNHSRKRQIPDFMLFANTHLGENVIR